ncbi:uncharacterized protein [Watersipora subatra]|uniref:uncharacterized protein n=1 Tax=Watersipora subatra TaxID=2589382 RepID=UPI00355B24DE
MAEGGLRAPGCFISNAGNPSETSRSWHEWLEQFNFYMLATEKSTKGGEIQVAILLTLLGPQGQEIFRTFNLPEEDRKDIEKVKEAFTRHFTPQVKIIYERYKFHNRTQLPGESFDNFLTALRGLLSTCNIHADEQNSALIDRIVCGINSPEVREDIFNLDGNPDLNKIIQLCRRAEATKHYLTDMKIDKENANINTVQQPNHLAHKNKNGARVNNCKYCKSSHPKGACPAYGKECRNCHKMNHFSIACMASQRKSAAKAAYELVETSGEQNDITFTVNNDKSRREWCITTRLLGMATYLSKFCPNLSDITTPLRELTKKNATWSWSGTHDESLAQLKAVVTSTPALRMFDPDLPIVLSVDSSQFGMGAVIMHNGQPIEFASCTLTDTQKKYAQIEKEYLAVQFGLRRFHQYIYGQHVVVETDHLPLIGIMNKGLNDISPRLLRMRLRNQLYDYTLVHKPGKALVLADTLSRAFLADLCEDAEALSSLDTEQIHSVTSGVLRNPTFKDRLLSTVQSDSTLQILSSYIRNGWPAKRRMCIEPLKPFWAARYDLTTHDGLILKNSQIVIPVSMRKQVIDIIHIGHLGVSKCIEKAKNSVYWPGYQGQIQDVVLSCATCQENVRANSQCAYEPYDIPQYPMQSVSIDVFHLAGKEYLVTVDRYSKWPTCCELKNANSSSIVEILRRQFLDFGRPEILVSDNASYFTSFEFEQFLKELEIQHITSSPYYSRSNGLAERMNQTIKSSLKKAHESNQTLFDVLASLRSTPLGGKLPSPSVLLQSRNLRNNLQFMPQQLKLQKVDINLIEKAFRERQSQDMFNTSPARRPIEMCVGMRVWCQLGHRRWVDGVIIRRAETPRSFYVNIGKGRVFRRNIKFLRPYKEAPTTLQSLQLENITMRNFMAVEHRPAQGVDHNDTRSEATQPLTSSDTSQSSHTTHQPSSNYQSLPSAQTHTTRSGRISKPPVRYPQPEN